MEQWDRFTAVFRPARTDDLREGAERMIGNRYRFMAAWVIEEGENEYAGQHACTVDYPFGEAPEEVKAAMVLWVPEGDLAEVEMVGRVTS